MESALLTRTDGSIVHVPVKDGLLLVGGEVLFTNTIAVEQRLPVPDYIERAGGYNHGFFSGSKVQVRARDHFLVLPKVDVKSWQIAKEIWQILYQLALMAGVVVRLF
jgi:hypothetical protein